MQYFINNKELSKKEFEIELEKRIAEYIPYSNYYPPKEKIKEILRKERRFIFNVYDKRYKDRLVRKDYDIFIAVEEEILDIESIVIENQFDPLNDDSLRISVALYEAGYRKINTEE